MSERNTFDVDALTLVKKFGLNDEQQKNLLLAKAAAAKFGVPESVLLGILWHEGKFLTDPGGNGGGMGQMLESTAKGYNLTQKQLKDSPQLAAEASARLLADNAKVLNGDWEKASAAYFVGAGTIQAASQGPGDWHDNADALGAKYGQGKVTDYLAGTQVFGGGNGTFSGSRDTLFGKTAAQIIQENGLKIGTSVNALNNYKPQDLPNMNDFYEGDGADRYLNVEAYKAALEAHKAYMDDRDANRAYNLGPLSQFIDDTIQQVTQEISAGNMSVSKANSLFQARLSSYSTALDAYSSKSFTQGAPVGAEFIPGREPGGFNERVLGLAPIRASHDVVLDPMAEAVKQYQDAKQSLDAIAIPTVPNYAAQRKALYDNAPGGTGTKPPPDPLAAAMSGFGGQTYNTSWTSQNEGA